MEPLLYALVNCMLLSKFGSAAKVLSFALPKLSEISEGSFNVNCADVTFSGTSSSFSSFLLSPLHPVLGPHTLCLAVVGAAPPRPAVSSLPPCSVIRFRRQRPSFSFICCTSIFVGQLHVSGHTGAWVCAVSKVRPGPWW